MIDTSIIIVINLESGLYEVIGNKDTYATMIQ